MPSLSFDPVAHLYDATRGYSDHVAKQIALSIDKVAHATSQTAFLEVGVGTGRIAVPLASLGRSYTGVDISEKMVEQLQAKLRSDGWQEQAQPWGTLADEDAARISEVRRFTQAERHASLRLVMADMTKLPFHDASFDVVVAVHVFHLVDGWQRAVQEVLHMLRPGGLFLHCWDEQGKSDVQLVSEQWHRIVQALGGNASRPGASSRQEVTELLQERGLRTEQSYTLSWEQSVTPRQVMKNITQRIWSNTWVIPDDMFTISVQRLQEWANNYYGTGIDTPRTLERRFVISKTQVWK